MTLRPQNRCTGCGYTWYPRGSNVSAKCPDCGHRGVVRVFPFVAVGTAGGGLIALCCLCFAGLVARGPKDAARRAPSPNPSAVTAREPATRPPAPRDRPLATPAEVTGLPSEEPILPKPEQLSDAKADPMPDKPTSTPAPAKEQAAPAEQPFVFSRLDAEKLREGQIGDFDPALTWPVIGVKEDDTILRTPTRNTTVRVRTKHLGKPAGDEATLPGLWRVVVQNRPTLGTVQFVLSPSSLDEAKRKGKSK